MTKGIGTPENREIAYRVFALFGGKHIEKILGRLNWEYGLDISRKTLYEWKSEGKWEERMSGAVEQGVMTFNERMLRRLLRLLQKYDVHFSGGGAVKDAQAVYAYTNLIRTAMELENRMNRWESVSPMSPEAAPGACVSREPDEEGHMTTLEDGIFFQDRGTAKALDADRKAPAELP